MKKILTFTILTLFGVAAKAQPFTEVKGKVNSSLIKTVCLFEVTHGRTDTLATTIPSADGSFGFLFKPAKSGYYTIGTKQWSHRLYLKAGDKANVALNDTLMTLVGPNTKENIALYKWESIVYKLNKMAVHFRSGRSYNYKHIFPEMELVADKGAAFIKTINTGNAAFDKLLAETVAFDIDYSALMSIFTPRSVHPRKEEYPATITNILTSKLYDNNQVLNQPYGFSLIYSVCALKTNYKKSDPLDLAALTSYVGGAQLKGEMVINRSEKFKSYLDYADAEAAYGKYITTPDQKRRMESIRAKLLVYQEGIAAYDFTYPDINGKNISLSDFKGKVVLVDVWATWCGPCKRELPHMQELEKEFHGKDVVFMSVSIDEKKNYEKWMAFVKEKELGGVQLFADGWSKITKDYKITGIPRFMLFDKEGKIITIDAPRPSNPKLKDLINQWLNK